MKTLYKTTLRILKYNKKRTFVTILGVILSSILMFGIGLMFSTMRENLLVEARRSGGYQHVTFVNMTPEKMTAFPSDKIDWLVEYQTLETIETINGIANLIAIEDVPAGSFELLSGRLPKKEQEILISSGYQKKNHLPVGSVMELENGRFYQVVGVYKESKIFYYEEKENNQREFFYTYQELSGPRTVALIYQDPKDAYQEIDKVAAKLELPYEMVMGEKQYEGVSINGNLLMLYGSIRDSSKMAMMVCLLIIVLSIFAICCYVVIYNSFSISTAERKKIYGVLKSEGVSYKQLVRATRLEVLIIGIIAISIAFVLSLGLVGVVLFILNKVVHEIGVSPFKVAIYPLFIIISLFFIWATLYISAMAPVYKTVKRSPIELLRQNSDIKIKKKHKLRKNKTKKRPLFGVLGNLAFKNFKRDQKKYKVTIVSLCISLILFMTFGTIIKQLINELNSQERTPGYQIYLYLPYSKHQESILNQIIHLEEIDDIYQKQKVFYYDDQIDPDEKEKGNLIGIVQVEDEVYEAYKKELGLTEDKIIFVNRKPIYHYNEEKSLYEFVRFDPVYPDPTTSTINLSQYIHPFPEIDSDLFPITFDNVFMTEKLPPVEENYTEDNAISWNSIILNEEQYQEFIYTQPSRIQEEATIKHLFIKTDSYKKLDNEIKDILGSLPAEERANITYENINMENYQIHIMILAVKIVLYSITFLIGLVAITNMVNTIHTNMILRSREIAILKSMGLSNRGLRKMVMWEGIYLALKTYLWGIPISLIIVMLIKAFYPISENEVFIFPYDYLLTSLLVIAVVIILTIGYSTKKIGKQNIIETIREDSI
jgi:hypothetical protein